MNLFKETLEKLKDNNKTFEDILWIGTRNYYVEKEKFKEIANIEYDNGYGGQEVAYNLIIVGDDWYLERCEYDGSEWWGFKKMPIKPNKKLDLKALTISQADENGMDISCGWETLEKMNIKEIERYEYE